MIESKLAFLQMQVEGLFGYSSELRWRDLRGMSKLRSAGSRHARHDGTSGRRRRGRSKTSWLERRDELKTFKLLLENEDEYNKMSRACIRDLAAGGYELPLMRTYPLTLFGGDRAAPGSRYRQRSGVGSRLALPRSREHSLTLFAGAYADAKRALL